MWSVVRHNFDDSKNKNKKAQETEGTGLERRVDGFVCRRMNLPVRLSGVFPSLAVWIGGASAGSRQAGTTVRMRNPQGPRTKNPRTKSQNARTERWRWR